MYYQRVYLDIFRAVANTYSHLLSDDEAVLLDKIVKLGQDAQLLLLRMLNRSRSWHRLDRMQYREIGFDRINFAELPEGLFEFDPPDRTPWLQALRVDELRTLAIESYSAGTSKVRKMSSSELVILLSTIRRPKQARICFEGGFKASRTDFDPVDTIKRMINDHLVRLTNEVTKFHDHLVLPLHFAGVIDPAQGLRGAMLAQVERRRYPPYHIIRSKPLFSDRQQFEDYHESVCYLQSLEYVPDEDSFGEIADNLCQIFTWWLGKSLPSCSPYFLRRFHPLWSIAKALEHVADRLEAFGKYEKAVRIYRLLLCQSEVCHGRRGDWWKRTILDLHKYLKEGETIVQETCRYALEDSHVRTGTRLSIARRLDKLSESPSQQQPASEYVVDYIETEPINNGSSQGVRYIIGADSEELVGVEELAIRHYSVDGWDGVHSESALFTMMFALVFWDIAFAAIPDVFQTPHQISPLDLRTDSFYENRKEAIEERLKQIESGEYDHVKLESAYNSCNGTMCIGVSWEAFSADQLIIVFKGLGRNACLVILRFIAMDYRNYALGMPDLVLWKDGQVMLVEVKSERDKLSDQQRVWLAILGNAGIQVRVCKVCAKIKK